MLFGQNVNSYNYIDEEQPAEDNSNTTNNNNNNNNNTKDAVNMSEGFRR